MKLDINRAVAFTGHRSQKLPFGFRETKPEALKLRALIRDEIEYAVLCGYLYFFSGMALGTDMIAAEEVLSLKKKRYPQIELIAAIPCREQYKSWSSQNIDRYNQILKQATGVIYVNDRNYFSGCMQARNRFLVKYSSLLIGVYDGSPGGTQATIEMADKKGSIIVTINPRTFIRAVPVDTEKRLEYYHLTQNRCKKQLELLEKETPRLLELYELYSDPYTTPVDRYYYEGRIRYICCGGPVQTDFTYDKNRD